MKVVQVGTMVRGGLRGEEVHEGAGTCVLRAGGLVPVTPDDPSNAAKLVEGTMEVLAQELVLGRGIGLSTIESINSANVEGTGARPGDSGQKPAGMGTVLGYEVGRGGVSEENGHTPTILFLDQGGREPYAGSLVAAGKGLGIGQAVGRVPVFLKEKDIGGLL